jgi:hypothetical protein
MLNAIDHLRSFEKPRMPGRPRPDLSIGPTRSRGTLLEVIVEITPPSKILVFHVMEARRKMLDLAEGRNNK